MKLLWTRFWRQKFVDDVRKQCATHTQDVRDLLGGWGGQGVNKRIMLLP